MIADEGAEGQVGEFAVLLRRERRAAGLTQADLAALAGVAVRTVRDAERGRTGRLQRNTAELLADALGLRAARRARFVAAARGERTAGPASLPPDPAETGAPSSPLPPAPTLIGRDAEIADLAEILTDPSGTGRPLTLVGVAGVGKSALLLAVAHRVVDRFPGGVGGVGIDEQGEVDETLATVAFVFGVADLTELADRVTRAPALLLLDAVDRAPGKVRQVLRRLPRGMRVLAAGHAPLDVPGEEVWPVGPLESPPAGTDAPLTEIETYPAAVLFLHRLARVRPYPLADEEVPALVSLVRRLGGLPLALELAAAHGRLLRLPEILERYGDRVLDLGSGAHQTLREAVSGSYRLLSAPEKYALRRLAVFRHRWSVEMAEELLGVTEDPLPLVDRLVSLGLVAVSGAREHRFRLLDVVRDFATEQAESIGELAPARRAHARVIAQLAGRVATVLSGAGSGQRAAVARLDDLAADIWAALSYAANDEPHTALRLASRLPRWWRLRGRDVAGRQWLRRLLDDPRTADADPAVRAWAQLGLAELAHEHGEGGAERPMAEEALARFRRLGDTDGELAACDVLSAVCAAQGRPDQAREFSESALGVATRTGRLRDAAAAHAQLTCHDVYVGDLASARRRLAIVDRMAGQSGQERLRLQASVGLAEVARLQGRYGEAVATGRRVLGRLAEVGDPGLRRRALATVGQALAMQGRVEESGKALASLRSVHGGTTAGAAFCALVEARLAMVQGDRVSAGEWFAAAAEAFRRGHEPRYAVESLVGLVACTTEPDHRGRVLAELQQAVRDGGFTLLPYERELLDSPAMG